MPLDDMIRAAVCEAARMNRFPENRDALALMKQHIISQEEGKRNG